MHDGHDVVRCSLHGQADTGKTLCRLGALNQVTALLDVQLRGLRQCRLRRLVVPELFRYGVERRLYLLLLDDLDILALLLFAPDIERTVSS